MIKSLCKNNSYLLFKIVCPIKTIYDKKKLDPPKTSYNLRNKNNPNNQNTKLKVELI